MGKNKDSKSVRTKQASKKLAANRSKSKKGRIIRGSELSPQQQEDAIVNSGENSRENDNYQEGNVRNDPKYDSRGRGDLFERKQANIEAKIRTRSRSRRSAERSQPDRVIVGRSRSKSQTCETAFDPDVDPIDYNAYDQQTNDEVNLGIDP